MAWKLEITHGVLRGSLKLVNKTELILSRKAIVPFVSTALRHFNEMRIIPSSL